MLRRLLKIPRTARRANQSILREINPEYLPPAVEEQSPNHWITREFLCTVMVLMYSFLNFFINICIYEIFSKLRAYYSYKTDAEAEAPIPWPPDVKSQLTGKDPDAGKDGGQEEKRAIEDKVVG